MKYVYCIIGMKNLNIKEGHTEAFLLNFTMDERLKEFIKVIIYSISFKLDKKPNHVYAILGDGEIQEGQIWEAAMSASHYKLNNVIAFLDYNKLQIDGSNDEVMTVSPVDKKFEAFGWYVQEIDGHNFEEIIAAVNNAKKSDRPSMIIANTIKGKGVSFMENKASWHGKAPNKEQYEEAIKDIENM